MPLQTARARAELARDAFERGIAAAQALADRAPRALDEVRTTRQLLQQQVGVGGDFVLARETTDVVDLKAETQLIPHALAGLEVRLWHVALGAEVNQAALTSMQVQLTGLF